MLNPSQIKKDVRRYALVNPLSGMKAKASLLMLIAHPGLFGDFVLRKLACNMFYGRILN